MKSNRFPEDSFLLSAIQQGDQKAFDTLFRKYYPMLCAYTNKFIDLADAEELVQDALLWIWENRKTVIFNTSLSAYLFKTLYHRALNKLAQQDAINRANTLFFENMQEMLQDTDYYQIEELTKRIKTAVEALPSNYRKAFTMHRFQNMSYKEIAIELNISPKTVDYRIQQSLKQLRIDLKDYLPSSLLITMLINSFSAI